MSVIKVHSSWNKQQRTRVAAPTNSTSNLRRTREKKNGKGAENARTSLYRVVGQRVYAVQIQYEAVLWVKARERDVSNGDE